MQEFLTFLKPCDWQTIIFMIVIAFYLLREMKTSFSKVYVDLKSLENSINQDIKSQTQRSDKLFEMYVQNQKDFQVKIDENRKESMEMRKEFQESMAIMRKKSNDLIREIHGRICSVEIKQGMTK